MSILYSFSARLSMKIINAEIFDAGVTYKYYGIAYACALFQILCIEAKNDEKKNRERMERLEKCREMGSEIERGREEPIGERIQGFYN